MTEEQKNIIKDFGEYNGTIKKAFPDLFPPVSESQYRVVGDAIFKGQECLGFFVDAQFARYVVELLNKQV